MALKPEHGNVVLRCVLQLLRGQPMGFDPKECRLPLRLKRSQLVQTSKSKHQELQVFD